jgi:uncharacterized membrane protein SirB2
VVYVVLGVYAPRRDSTHAARAAFLLAALAVYLLIISITLSRQPLRVFCAPMY